MKLTERLNVLIQAATLSQKGGVLTLDEAVKAKSAIDVISTGNINQNFPPAINTLIELAISSQKKGVYSLKDAHMLYMSIDGIEVELQNEVNKLNGIIQEGTQANDDNRNNENVIVIPPKQLKKKS